MIHVYIIGPFSGSTNEQIEENIRKAERAAGEIISRSCDFVCLVPHSLGRKFKNGPGTLDYWYRASFSLLTRCDVAIALPGWENSKGSRNEMEWCLCNGVNVFYSADDLLGYYDFGAGSSRL